MPRFAKDQIVVANAATQGLRQGAKYRVADVRTLTLPFGWVVEYDLIALNPTFNNVVGLVNGHLLLTEDRKDECCPDCGKGASCDCDDKARAEYESHLAEQEGMHDEQLDSEHHGEATGVDHASYAHGRFASDD